MIDQGSPTKASATDAGSIRLPPSCSACPPISPDETAKVHIIRDSLEIDLQASGSDGIKDRPRSTAPSPTFNMPVDLAISTFGVDKEIARPTGSSHSDVLSKPIIRSLPLDAKNGLSDLAIITSGASRIDEAASSSSYLPHIEIPLPVLVRPSILVVDDQAPYRELIGDILGDEYEILFAASGMEALEMALIKVPDLILLDVMMPGIDGYKVNERLKQDQRTCEIPIIFISGLDDVAAETKGLMSGAVDYVTKPIERERVRARVRTQIKLKLAQDKLTQLAETDGLTGLPNRRHFDKMLAYECARHQRSEKELSLILLDIDHFKAFNDTYGHVRGDQCLRDIARALAKTVSRATDLVARYGGEEFVALLPETPLKGAVKLAERVRACISDLELAHRGSSAGYVTASLGVVSGRLLTANSIMDVVHAADVELYAAKAGGRNRVSFRAIDRFGLTH